jgi:hypothetical protein
VSLHVIDRRRGRELRELVHDDGDIRGGGPVDLMVAAHVERVGEIAVNTMSTTRI